MHTLHTRDVPGRPHSIHATRWLLSGEPFDIEIARATDNESSLTIEQDGKSITLVMHPSQLAQLSAMLECWQTDEWLRENDPT